MLPLNSFIEDNKDRITQFFNDLCEVEEFHEQLEVFFFFSFLFFFPFFLFFFIN